ncbi:MAG TPA: TetR/AcrR family transcriptional regulator [Caulobacteraceae bacterium]|jgi:AcrR family transcriptional regulator|nr:TetR/AcrR family transcriptional regulator [Caulobacteraceae bacterium]
MGQDETISAARPRVVKAPAVRRAELIDCAQRLFLRQGYERTTINEVISATGLSKGAFYHHFRSKEDLLEAIAGGFARQSVAFVDELRATQGLNALQRLNRLLAFGREWKLQHVAELKAMFTTLLKPQNAVLYHRIVEAVFSELAPALAAIIDEGEHEGVFAAGDARTAADTLLWLSNARRPIVIAALALAETDVEAGLAMLVRRLRAEEAITGRILGLPVGAVELLGSLDELRAIVAGWRAAAQGSPAAV